MKRDHLIHLVCPKSKRDLVIKDVIVEEGARIKEGILQEPISGMEYKITNFVPRFVDPRNYTESFGYQWNLHNKTQHDSANGMELSRTRFIEETKWDKKLDGQLVLEAGCGSGRFTPHALETGATVVSFDYSDAVDASYLMNGKQDRLLIVQANIYETPFSSEYFDKVFCFGVLQHTPDPLGAFENLVTLLAGSGSIATDVYWKSIRSFFHVRYWLRPFTKNRDPESLYKLVCRYVDLLWPLAGICRKNYYTQKLFARFVADRSDYLSFAPDEELKKWAYLDTFDWFSPAYDSPQTKREFRKWHTDAGLHNIDVCRGYNGLEGRGEKVR